MQRIPRLVAVGSHRPDGLNLVENCLDSLCSAAEYLLPEQRDTKTSVLWAVAGAEQLIKSLLASEHWTLVVQGNHDIRHNTRSRYLQGEVVTVGFEAGLKRLAHCTDVEVSDSAKNCLLNLNRLRNRLAHFDQPREIDAAVELLKSAVQHSVELYLIYLHDRVGAIPEAGTSAGDDKLGREVRRRLWESQEEWEKRSLLSVTPGVEHELLKRLFGALLPLMPPSKADRALRRRSDLTLINHRCFLCGKQSMQYLASSARCTNCNAFGTLDLLLRKVFEPRNRESEAELYEPYPTHPRHTCKVCNAPIVYSHIGPGVHQHECVRCSWSIYSCMECLEHPDDCACCAVCSNRKLSEPCHGKSDECPRRPREPAAE